MAEESAEERTERISKEVQDRYVEEGKAINEAAIAAREDEPDEQGLQTMDDYRAHVAAVPGIFGDTDTGAATGVADVVSHNNEAATVAVAEVDASDDDETSHDEARRQVDADNTVPSAETVEEGAEEQEADRPVVSDEPVVSDSSEADEPVVSSEADKPVVTGRRGRR